MLVLVGQVKEEFTKAGLPTSYYICIVKMDPSKMGEPVTRRRIYILFLRKILGCIQSDE